jgi:hypothetical protein
LGVQPLRVEPVASGRVLDFDLGLKRVVTNQTQHRLNAFATLGATTTGFINVARPWAAGPGYGLLHAFIGQRIT